jgi:hypothetical protein
LKTIASESGVKWGEGGMCIQLTDSLFLSSLGRT